MQLYIPNCLLREKIVQKVHGEGYFRRDKIHIHNKYYQPKMKHDMIQHVERCLVCQVLKGMVTNARLYTSLPILSHPWEVSIDCVGTTCDPKAMRSSANGGGSIL